MSDVCPCIAALDRAETAILHGAVPEFALHLQTAIDLLQAGQQDSNAAGIARRVKMLNTLYEHARRYHAGWAALAGVADADINRGSVQVKG